MHAIQSLVCADRMPLVVLIAIFVVVMHSVTAIAVMLDSCLVELMFLCHSRFTLVYPLIQENRQGALLHPQDRGLGSSMP